MRKSALLILCLLMPAHAADPNREPVRLGIDVLVEQGFSALQGKQVGLITNHTGHDSRGQSTADLLAQAPGVKIVALFSPEHGIRGSQEAGQLIRDQVDSRLRLPVYSLYGSVQKPTPAMLNAVDVIVFDLQDVGARYYTYLTTMGLAMEAAAERGIGFIVLDRPNPAGGQIVEGQVLSSSIRHFTAYYGVPVRHGMTAGEMAQWYKQTSKLNVKLTVIPMRGWKREWLWADTRLRFIPPSPNIRTPLEALLYTGMGMFEATNLSVGRGTDKPFEVIGAPWIDGKALAARLNALNLPGLSFEETTFTPQRELYEKQVCYGVKLKVHAPHALRPVDLFVQISGLMRELWPREFTPRWDEVARVTGSMDFETLYKANKPVSEILDVFHRSAEQFMQDRVPYLLY